MSGRTDRPLWPTWQPNTWCRARKWRFSPTARSLTRWPVCSVRAGRWRPRPTRCSRLVAGRSGRSPALVVDHDHAPASGPHSLVHQRLGEEPAPSRVTPGPPWAVSLKRGGQAPAARDPPALSAPAPPGPRRGRTAHPPMAGPVEPVHRDRTARQRFPRLRAPGRLRLPAGRPGAPPPRSGLDDLALRLRRRRRRRLFAAPGDREQPGRLHLQPPPGLLPRPHRQRPGWTRRRSSPTTGSGPSLNSTNRRSRPRTRRPGPI